jgi:hypothetical protein
MMMMDGIWIIECWRDDEGRGDRMGAIYVILVTLFPSMMHQSSRYILLM